MTAPVAPPAPLGSFSFEAALVLLRQRLPSSAKTKHRGSSLNAVLYDRPGQLSVTTECGLLRTRPMHDPSPQIAKLSTPPVPLPSASAAANEAHDEQQQHSTYGGVDDRADH